MFNAFQVFDALFDIGAAMVAHHAIDFKLFLFHNFMIFNIFNRMIVLMGMMFGIAFAMVIIITAATVVIAA